jgi:hypothetical protein
VVPPFALPGGTQAWRSRRSKLQAGNFSKGNLCQVRRRRSRRRIAASRIRRARAAICLSRRSVASTSEARRTCALSVSFPPGSSAWVSLLFSLLAFAVLIDLGGGFQGFGFARAFGCISLQGIEQRNWTPLCRQRRDFRLPHYTRLIAVWLAWERRWLGAALPVADRREEGKAPDFLRFRRIRLAEPAEQRARRMCLTL